MMNRKHWTSCIHRNDGMDRIGASTPLTTAPITDARPVKLPATSVALAFPRHRNQYMYEILVSVQALVSRAHCFYHYYSPERLMHWISEDRGRISRLPFLLDSRFSFSLCNLLEFKFALAILTFLERNLGLLSTRAV